MHVRVSLSGEEQFFDDLRWQVAQVPQGSVFHLEGTAGERKVLVSEEPQTNSLPHQWVIVKLLFNSSGLFHFFYLNFNRIVFFHFTVGRTIDASYCCCFYFKSWNFIMYACMHVCMHVCMYTCMYVCDWHHRIGSQVTDYRLQVLFHNSTCLLNISI